MDHSMLRDHSIESYITSTGERGYYLLASDGQRRWYWGELPHPEQPDFVPSHDFHGPYHSRGRAIIAGEDWVEAALSA